MAKPPRILIIATSAATMDGGSTGLWLEELTTPYYAFRDAGADVTLASIAGGAIPIDPRSVKPAGENDASVERYLADEAFSRRSPPRRASRRSARKISMRCSCPAGTAPCSTIRRARRWPGWLPR